MAKGEVVELDEGWEGRCNRKTATSAMIESDPKFGI